MSGRRPFQLQLIWFAQPSRMIQIRTTRSHIAAGLLPLAAVGLLAGCGGDDDDGGSAATTTPPAATTAAPATSSRDLTVTTTEFKFAPSTLSAPAGKVKFTLQNQGQAEHELVVLKTNTAAGSLKATGGRVSEADSVGEVSETKAGATKSATLNLKPGRYVFVCNIPGHYQGGMRGVLTVK